jgi:hypothetical protein
MPFPRGTLIWTQEGYKPIEDIEPDDYLCTPSGLETISAHRTTQYVGYIYHLYTEYHSKPLRCTGDQLIRVRDAPNGFKPAREITTEDWIGMWRPWSPLSLSMSVSPESPSASSSSTAFASPTSLSRSSSTSSIVSSPAPLEDIETYSEALTLQSTYLFHQRPLQILETYRRTYLCFEPPVPKEIGFDTEYVWFRVLHNLSFYQQEWVYDIEVSEGGHYTVEGFLV